jgi:hypothetical protein
VQDEVIKTFDIHVDKRVLFTNRHKHLIIEPYPTKSSENRKNHTTDAGGMSFRMDVFAIDGCI